MKDVLLRLAVVTRLASRWRYLLSAAARILMLRSGALGNRGSPREMADSDNVVLSCRQKLACMCNYANGMLFRCCGEFKIVLFKVSACL